MSVFNEKIQNPRSMFQETQQKTFKFVESSRGEINFSPPPPTSFQHLRSARRAFMLNMEAIPTSHIIRLYGTSHIIKSLPRAGLPPLRSTCFAAG